MKTYKLALAAIVPSLLLMSACSNKAAYEIMQANKKQACERVAEGQAREDCLRGYQKSFDDYERERNALIGNKEIAVPKLKLSVDKDHAGKDSADSSN